jgi:hypothetical protein
MGKNVFHTMVDEGHSTCIIFISCWKALESPKIDSSTTLLKELDGNMFQPHGIITTLPIELGGNIFFVVVEFVNAPLEYIFLLRHTWFYEMTIVFLCVFRVLGFPHQGKIMTIDQLAFYIPYLG